VCPTERQCRDAGRHSFAGEDHAPIFEVGILRVGTKKRVVLDVKKWTEPSLRIVGATDVQLAHLVLKCCSF
jgi:hypothetical protein